MLPKYTLICFYASVPDGNYCNTRNINAILNLYIHILGVDSRYLRDLSLMSLISRFICVLRLQVMRGSYSVKIRNLRLDSAERSPDGD